MKAALLLNPQEDELAISHVQRMAQINDWSGRLTPTLLRNALSHSQPEFVRTTSLVRSLAMLVGMPIGEYIQKHTALPLLKLAAWPSDITAHGLANENVLSAFGMRTARAGGFVCPDCVDNQLADEGLSWYRRSHHVFGVDWCPDHGTPLRAVQSTRPFDRSPDIWLRSGKTTVLPACTGRLESMPSFIQQLTALSSSAYKLASPISALLLKCACCIRANASGLRLHGSHRLPTFSDHLMRSAPKKWVESHLPGLTAKKHGDFFPDIDDLLVTGAVPTTMSTLVALASLFEDSITALEQLFRQDPHILLA